MTLLHGIGLNILLWTQLSLSHTSWQEILIICTKLNYSLVSSVSDVRKQKTWNIEIFELLSLINCLIPRSRVLLEKLIVTHVVKKFPNFYGNGRFITVFTRALHWCISCLIIIRSTYSHPLSLRFILIFSFLSTPKSSEWSPPCRIPDQNFVSIYHLSHSCFMPRPYPPWFYTLIMKHTSYEAPHYAVFSSLPTFPPS